METNADRHRLDTYLVAAQAPADRFTQGKQHHAGCRGICDVKGDRCGIAVAFVFRRRRLYKGYVPAVGKIPDHFPVLFQQ